MLTYGLFPVTFVVAMSVAIWGVGADLPKPALLAAIAVSVAVLIAVFERIHPHFDSWNRSRGDVKTDSIHLLVSLIALPPLLEIGLLTLMFGISVRLSEAIGFSLWPSDYALVVQLCLAMLISQFGEYWAHRSMHEVPLLWRLHATHHSPDRLYWLNAARFHPIDTAISYIAGNTPLLLLGAGPDVLLLYNVWIAVHGMFQHCNIRVKLGPLNWIFSMAELHRWHHSLVLEEANANYGNNILLWDIVFGTVYWPADREAAENIGLSEIPNFPKDYIGQILSPFRWARYEGDR
jgi:sterol desaturase/sphingolipid hydroxylase (fatty acid hydroxylase superfamily)